MGTQKIHSAEFLGKGGNHVFSLLYLGYHSPVNTFRNEIHGFLTEFPTQPCKLFICLCEERSDEAIPLSCVLASSGEIATPSDFIGMARNDILMCQFAPSPTKMLL